MRISFQIIIFIFFSLLSQSVFSSENSAQDFCQKNGLRKIILLADFKDLQKDVNYCQVSYDSLPLKFKELILNIGHWNKQISNVLGISYEQLLPNGLDLYFEPNVLGPTVSKGGKDGLTIAYYLDGELSDFSPHVYAHELTHTMVATEGGLLHKIVGDYASHALFAEPFADLVAHVSFKTTLLRTSEGKLPASLEIIRNLSEYESFEMTFRKVVMGSMDPLIEICRSKQFEASYRERLESICTIYDFVVNPAADSTWPPQFSTEVWNAPFDPMNCRSGPDKILLCDDHLYAAPLNSFLLALGQELDLPIVKEYLQALLEVNTLKMPVICSYNGESKLFYELRFSFLMNKLKEKALNSGKLEQFQYLAKRHGLHIMARLDEFLFMDDAKKSAEIAFPEARLEQIHCSIP